MIFLLFVEFIVLLSVILLMIYIYGRITCIHHYHILEWNLKTKHFVSECLKCHKRVDK